MKNPTYLAKLFLRMGLAFVFVYASIEIYFHPENFLKYIPSFAFQKDRADLFLNLFGIGEAALAFWLLSGKKGLYSSLLSVLILVGIVAFNMEYLQILFRNVAIAFAAAALFALEINKQTNTRLI